jgi:hypothetical protein
MDPSVYWPWLWVGLAKDLRDELDERQAMVDGAVYTSFALAAAYLVYRASLRAHGQFGELFCAVFNRFHHEVDVAPALRQAGGILARPDCSVGAERYRNAARFLRWHVYRPHGATENLPLPNHLGRRG